MGGEPAIVGSAEVDGLLRAADGPAADRPEELGTGIGGTLECWSIAFFGEFN